MLAVLSSFILVLFVPAVVSSHFPASPHMNSRPLSTRAGSQTFKLQDNIVGKDFFSHFSWDTFDDPTHGRVNYLDQATAIQRTLASATSNSFIMRADNTTIVPSSARGRDSNRIRSYSTYSDSITVLDVKHVPWGCATWPAFWTETQNNWPIGGEIDIIEGINTDRANLASLHTSPNCTMDPNRPQTGAAVSADCNAFVNYNQGCGTSFRKPGSYGPDLNAMGGGWFVMKRTQTDGVYIWFFGRNDRNVPPAVRGGNQISPDNLWGEPDASFPSSKTCNFASHFDAHEIVFDLTFCGDYAGTHFSSSCGPSTCSDFVNNNPQKFTDAYWEINALRIYTPM